jgi:hypothetical protein
VSSRTSPSSPTPSPRRNRSVQAAFAAVAVAVVSALTYIRLYYGVDLTDESFYIAVPYRFALGARPLTDETNAAQLTASVLLYPFVKLYAVLVGVTGIVLYMRHLYFAMCVATSLGLFTALRRCRLDAAFSLAVAAAPIVVVPFSIFGLSYNTLARNLFTLGCFYGVAWLVDGRRLLLVVAGTSVGLAVFTYPPFVPAVAVFFVVVYLASRPRSVRAVLPGLLAAVVCILGTVAFFLQDGIGTASDLFGRASKYTGQGGSVGKPFDVISSALSAYPHPYLAVVLVVAAFGLRRWRSWALVVPVTALPLTAIPTELGDAASAEVFVTNFALLAPILFTLAPRDALAQKFMAVVWLPAAVAGEMTAFTSSNGSVNFAIGIFPGAIVTAILAGLVVERALQQHASGLVEAILVLTPAVIAMTVGVALQYSYVYRDDSVRHLTRRITNGPYAGLLTTPAKREFLSQLNRDLQETSGRRCRILFYDDFPAGYLLGRGRPDTNTVWLLGVVGTRRAAYDRLLVNYYKKQGELPDIVVRMTSFPEPDMTPETYRASDPLERLFTGKRYVVVRERNEYRISRKAGTTCR